MNETDRAGINFPFSHPPFAVELIAAVLDVKEAAALGLADVRALPRETAAAIARAAREIRADLPGSLPTLTALQGGAGTSLHMSVLEAVASRATRIRRRRIDPLDDVNRGQSTNDVLPTALRIATLRLLGEIDAAGRLVVRVLRGHARSLRTVRKLARTHLQDAIPTTLGAEFATYASLVERDLARLRALSPMLAEVSLGGTATGSGVNAPAGYAAKAIARLRRTTKLPLRASADRAALTSSQTDFTVVSAALRALTLDLSKMANDLRLLASGPRGGLGEISLPALQDGSTIMPGKVNPVQLEALNALHFHVLGNDAAIVAAAGGAQLELAVFWPVVADRLVASLRDIADVLPVVSRATLAGIRANRARCRTILEHSTAEATLLVPVLGHATVAELVREVSADHVTLRALVLSRKLLTGAAFDRLTKPRD